MSCEVAVFPIELVSAFELSGYSAQQADRPGEPV